MLLLCCQPGFGHTAQRKSSCLLRGLTHPLGDSRQDLLQRAEVGGLDQVMIESRLPRTLPFFLIAVPRHGDQHDVVQSGLLTDPLRHFKTIQLRQADVQQDHVG